MAQRRINIRRAGLDETLSNLDIQVSVQSCPIENSYDTRSASRSFEFYARPTLCLRLELTTHMLVTDVVDEMCR